MREATKRELEENLLRMNVVIMIKKDNLDKNLCINALTYLMFLKRNMSGAVKAHDFADNSPQREYIGKEETNSPTVSIYVLMAACAINIIRGRHVITCNILGAFL